MMDLLKTKLIEINSIFEKGNIQSVALCGIEIIHLISTMINFDMILNNVLYDSIPLWRKSNSPSVMMS